MKTQAPARAAESRQSGAIGPVQEFTGENLFRNNGPEAIAQRKLADAIASGPRVASQRKLANAIRISPRMTAQRQRIQEMYGHTAQLKEGPEEEELLQGRFAPLNGTTSFPSEPVAQAVFSQNPAANIQHSVHGGVSSDYDTPRNIVELHIAAGANNNGNMMQDFLSALWEARDTIVAGQARGVAGGVFMRPGGSQVLKMTMEMLGEALGQGPSLGLARAAKAGRKAAAIPLWVDPTGANRHDDILDASVVPENMLYRDSMVGAAGIDMRPIGAGTSQGTEDMLGNTAAAANERGLYDTALLALQPFMSLAITIDLATVNRVIDMIEGQIPFFHRVWLKAKYLKNG